MAKIVINGNKVFFRHWFRWYTVIGRQAHRINFNRGQTVYEKRNGDSVQSDSAR